jgi:TonB-dependent receptor
MLRKILFALLLSSSTIAFAQTGSISGTVTDAKTGETVVGANIVIVGTTIGAASDIDGKFIINNVKPGTYSLLVTFVTYKSYEIKDVVVETGKLFIVKAALSEEAQELSEIVVTGQADKTSESILLTERKNSALIVQNIGAQELSRKGVTDAEAAVTQVTGISKQQGVKNVFVRGLGDRYNSTSLNGLPLPSENPEYKNITLDFFSSDIINSIDVNKTFDPTLYGDVAGANINIVSKNLFEEQELSVGVSLGVNSQTIGNNFLTADGTNFLGTSDNTIPITNLSTLSFKSSYQPNQTERPLLNSGLSISGGKNFAIKNNSLKTFLLASMTSEYLFIEGVVRQVNPTGGVRQDFTYDKSEYSTSQIVLGNANYQFGVNKNNSISYNGIFIHDNDQAVGNYTGFSLNANDDIQDPNAYKTFVRRQQQNNNSLFVNQLLTEFNFTDKVKLNLGGSFNIAKGDEPDRRSNFYIFDGEDYTINSGSPAYNHRFYSSLEENDFAANVALTYLFKKQSTDKLVVGYNFRSTQRDFESTQFNFDFGQGDLVEVNNPDALFNQQSLDNNRFDLTTGRGFAANALTPFTYNGDRIIHSVFANSVVTLSSAFTVSLGLRFESFRQQVDWDTNLQELNPNNPEANRSVRNPSYVLPSVNLKYSLSENDFLRLASSLSYTFPQFKEVAPFFYENVNDASFGNPDLQPAENFNTDIRYEHYFTNSEFISVTGFYKRIANAINRVQVSSAANELSYVNTGDANVAGVEIETRKSIVSSIDMGLNVSYLYSNQGLEDVPTDKLVFQPTDKESALEGASPLLVNADVTYKKEFSTNKKLTTSLNFNYFSDRIFSIGAPTGNNHIIENNVARLDIITKLALSHRVSIGLNLRNLLNPSYKLTKEIDSGKDEIISSYKRGVGASLSFTYKL